MSTGPGKAPVTAQQTALSSVAAQQYNNYMTNYRPFEDKYAADVTGDTTARTAKVTGRVNADVAQASAIKPSVDPTSGKFFGAVSSDAPVKAKSKAIVQGTQAVENQQINAEQGIVNMGQGKAATTQAGMSDLASNAASSAINDARLNVNNQMFTNNMIGSTLGAVAYGVGKYGGKSAIGAGDITDGTNGVTSGPDAGQDMYAGDLR